MEYQVERIVREVMARLASDSHGTARQNRIATTAASPGHENAKSSTDANEIENKVVCLADLDGRLNGTKRLVLRRGAVITPAARDLLRQSGIDVSYRIGETKKTVKRVSLVIGLVATEFDPSTLLSHLRQHGASVAQIASTGLIGVIDELTDHVARGGQQALLLTGQSLAAVCLANRVEGVRAVVARSTWDVRRAVAEVGVNFLVVDPATVTQFELQRMAAELQRSYSRCPEKLTSRLGP